MRVAPLSFGPVAALVLVKSSVMIRTSRPFRNVLEQRKLGQPMGDESAKGTKKSDWTFVDSVRDPRTPAGNAGTGRAKPTEVIHVKATAVPPAPTLAIQDQKPVLGIVQRWKRNGIAGNAAL